MRRSVLITVAALGVVICVIGATGLFAALSDTARTGTNTVDSAGLAASADIRLATATRDATGVHCGSYSENLASGFFSVADVSAGYSSPQVYFCIKNVGSQGVGLWPNADELHDIDFACTGDEALAGDTTCGADGTGELSGALFVSYTRYNDCSASEGGGFSTRLRDNAVASAVGLGGVLPPGQETCLSVSIIYGAETPAAAQQAQSDRATWRFKFRADAF